ncbi:MAG TPA: hypothetical protein VFE63_06405 [Roseiarcus sp.]|nr:hypothetical protein [Roseiarcus sp.]
MSGRPPEDNDGDRGRGRANVAALIAIVILALLAYWAFTAIEHMRELQNCLAEGRRNCQEIGSPSR